MSREICTEHGIEQYTVDITKLFGGYIPKNNKLYQFPYAYVLCSNNNGAEMTLKYEYSDDESGVLIEIWGNETPMPAVLLYPVNYEGVTGSNYMHRLQYTNFGQCSWKNDAYTAWLAQNRNTIAYSVASSVIQPLKGVIGGAMSGGAPGAVSGAIGGLASGADSVFSLMAQARDRQIVPPEVHGQADSMNINSSYQMCYFTLYKMSCSYDMAESIDNFWSAFGYPIRKVETPNLTSRSAWNYIKTRDCGIHGNVELDQLAKLRDIFDKGVTVWHTDDVGNYGLDNN